MLQTCEVSEAQLLLADFCDYNSSQLTEGVKKQGVCAPKSKVRRKLKRHEVRIKSRNQLPKVLIAVGDTQLVRDFIVNELKPRFNLEIQTVPATVKRTAQTFKA